MRGVRECAAPYADNLLLFLQDPGPSLQVASKILNTFSTYSGLRVNCRKSSVLPIDSGAQVLAAPDIPIPWVTQIKYLGIVISAKVTDFWPSVFIP